MKKKQIFITDLMLHTKEHRPTASLDRAVKKNPDAPRFYAPHVTPESFKKNPDGTFHFEIPLPQDVLDGIDKGEIEIVMPEGGALVYAGKDTIEKMKQMQEKDRNQIIHSGRVWKKDGV